MPSQLPNHKLFLVFNTVLPSSATVDSLGFDLNLLFTLWVIARAINTYIATTQKRVQKQK